MYNLRFFIGIGLIVLGASFIPMIYGDGDVGDQYWKFYVPSMIIGGGGMTIAFLGLK